MSRYFILQALTILLSCGLIGIASLWVLTIREARQQRRKRFMNRLRFAKRSKRLSRVLAHLERRRA
ncbi:MAG: hypothetical protein ACYS47_01420 [Planctomycetota bacterium]|jgi:2-phosphoglycerate kinase